MVKKKLHHSKVAFLGSSHQSSCAIISMGSIHISTPLTKLTDYLQVAIAASRHQSSYTIISFGSIHTGSTLA